MPGSSSRVAFVNPSIADYIRDDFVTANMSGVNLGYWTRVSSMEVSMEERIEAFLRTGRLRDIEGYLQPSGSLIVLGYGGNTLCKINDVAVTVYPDGLLYIRLFEKYAKDEKIKITKTPVPNKYSTKTKVLFYRTKKNKIRESFAKVRTRLIDNQEQDYDISW